MNLFLHILAWLIVAIVVGLFLLLVVICIGGTLAFAAGLVGHPIGASGDRVRPVRVRPRIPAALRRQVLARDGYVCQECGATEELEMDHIIPVSRGGATTLENLQVMCHDCNQRKGALP